MLSKKIKKTTSVIMAMICMIPVFSAQTYADGWVKNDKGYIYEYDDGTTAEKGWLEVDGKKYYIQKDGTRKTGWLNTKKGAKYYLKKDGTMAVGWLKLSEGKYYFDKNGIMQTGYKKIGKKIYLFNSDGLLLEQVKNEIVEIDGKYYYCLKDGSLAKGMVDIPLSDGTYLTAYFGKDGYSVSGKKEIDGIMYVFDESKGLIDSYLPIPTTVNCRIKYKNIPCGIDIRWFCDFPSAELRAGSLYYELDCFTELKNRMNKEIRITVKANVFNEDGYVVDDYIIADANILRADNYNGKKTLYLDFIPSKIEITEITIYFT